MAKTEISAPVYQDSNFYKPLISRGTGSPLTQAATQPLTRSAASSAPRISARTSGSSGSWMGPAIGGLAGYFLARNLAKKKQQQQQQPSRQSSSGSSSAPSGASAQAQLGNYGNPAQAGSRSPERMISDNTKVVNDKLYDIKTGKVIADLGSTDKDVSGNRYTANGNYVDKSGIVYDNDGNPMRLFDPKLDNAPGHYGQTLTDRQTPDFVLESDKADKSLLDWQNQDLQNRSDIVDQAMAISDLSQSNDGYANWMDQTTAYNNLNSANDWANWNDQNNAYNNLNTANDWSAWNDQNNAYNSLNSANDWMSWSNANDPFAVSTTPAFGIEPINVSSIDIPNYDYFGLNANTNDIFGLTPAESFNLYGIDPYNQYNATFDSLMNSQSTGGIGYYDPISSNYDYSVMSNPVYDSSSIYGTSSYSDSFASPSYTISTPTFDSFSYTPSFSSGYSSDYFIYKDGGKVKKMASGGLSGIPKMADGGSFLDSLGSDYDWSSLFDIGAGTAGAGIGALLGGLLSMDGGSGGQNQGLDMSQVSAIPQHTTTFGMGPANYYNYPEYTGQINQRIPDQSQLYKNLSAPGSAGYTPSMADGGSTSYYTYGTNIDPNDAFNVEQPFSDYKARGYSTGGSGDGGYASGGSAQVDYGNEYSPHRVDFRQGAAVNGPGDGQSDDIPAMLADGEYVIDAETVAMLGNGSNKAGAKALDEFRENIRSHKRDTPVNKIPPKSKGALAYLSKGK